MATGHPGAPDSRRSTTVPTTSAGPDHRGPYRGVGPRPRHQARGCDDCRHAWSYDLGGALVAAKGFRDDQGFVPGEHGLVELPVEVWEGWAFGHALHPVGTEQVPSFTEHLGGVAGLVAPYDCGRLVLADRHTYEVAANWKVIAENYHECYHCPLIHPSCAR